MHVDLFGASLGIDASTVTESPDEIRRQVREYAAGDRRAFDLDIAIPDTFAGRVMAAMAEIPYGETRTYGDLAAALDTAPVAVGGACGRNPLPVVVPCHRVVGADSVGGYSGDGGRATKRALLDHEARGGGHSSAGSSSSARRPMSTW